MKVNVIHDLMSVKNNREKYLHSDNDDDNNKPCVSAKHTNKEINLYILIKQINQTK